MKSRRCSSSIRYEVGAMSSGSRIVCRRFYLQIGRHHLRRDVQWWGPPLGASPVGVGQTEMSIPLYRPQCLASLSAPPPLPTSLPRPPPLPSPTTPPTSPSPP